MNKKENDILKAIIYQKNVNQRNLSKITGYSLGTINSVIKMLISKNYIDKNMNLTKKTEKYIKEKSPQNAIILAAGYGMRMVPINLEKPKGIIEINGEALIERIIKQLNEVGIKEIYIVVGFMKEAYEYLIDKYNVNLIVNKDYSTKNNLYSLKCALSHLSNSYIIPCDVWCEENPFNEEELYSWYMISNDIDERSEIKTNKKSEIILKNEIENGNKMIGISYVDKEKSDIIKKRILSMCKDKKYDNAYWEESLFENNKMILYARNIGHKKVIEINTYEQLRELDDKSKNLQNDAIEIISEVLNVESKEIKNIKVLKKGMTNRSFLFKCKANKYIMRIPGEGTDKLINRKEEANVYKQLKGKNICDNIIYINPENGYKITEFFDNAKVCNPLNEYEVKKCMKKLKEFHNMKLKVKHEFNIYKQIDFYEKLWNGQPSIYKEYNETKKKIKSLKKIIDKYKIEKVLTHIDAVPDNFLFIKDKDNKECIKLIDWEYSAMQDPHLDIAMFGIYSLYNKEQIDRLIDYYFSYKCKKTIRIKIYCYIATCGLLWSNWCEYKRNLGIDFGEYALQQYRYAKEYYKVVVEELKKLGENIDA